VSEPCTLVAFVESRTGGEVLADPEGPTVLPSATVEPQTTEIQATIDRLLGGPAVLLRVTSLVLDAQDDEPVLIAVEASMSGEPPAPFRWNAPELIAGRLRSEPLAEAFHWWRERRTHAGGPFEPAWAVPGWLERASAWMSQQMTALGNSPTDGPRMHYLWPLAALLVASGTGGRMLLKCPAPTFATEATITRLLAHRTPGAVTPVAAIEADEGWLLMHDFGDRRLGDGPPASWAAGLVRFAEIQLAWSEDLEPLRAAGARLRPIRPLAAHAESFVEDPAVPLTSEQRDRARAALPRLVAACEGLDALGPQESLIHGDLHPWNMVVGPEGPLIFDWSDAGIGHPFLDLPVFIAEAKDVADRLAIRAAYVDAWAMAWERSKVEAAADLALVVGALNQAQAYRQLMLDLDPHDHAWLHHADAAWLLVALDALERGIELRRQGA
jgi:hypothetical protein